MLAHGRWRTDRRDREALRWLGRALVRIWAGAAALAALGAVAAAGAARLGADLPPPGELALGLGLSAGLGLSLLAVPVAAVRCGRFMEFALAATALAGGGLVWGAEGEADPGVRWLLRGLGGLLLVLAALPFAARRGPARRVGED